MNRYFIKGILLVLAALLLPVAVGAADNAGFKKDVPPVLKERFGLCDEFLDVKWIDKSGAVGMLKADVYKNGKSEPRFLIVRIEKPGSKAFAIRGNGIFYEISEKEYSSKDFEKFLRGARYSFKHHNVFMVVTKGKKSERYPQEPLPFEAFANHELDFPNRSFSDFSKTVCVAYPDEKRAFVIEAKKPFIKSPADEKSKQAYDTVARFAKEKCAELAKDECSLNYLKDTYALDSNGDGKDDYIFLIADKAGKKQSKRYMLISGKDEYSIKDVSGCLGLGRSFYGMADTKSFHLGRCLK